MIRTDLMRAAERVRKLARQHDARKLRASGMSREEVARRFGVDPATVTRWTAKGQRTLPF